MFAHFVSGSASWMMRGADWGGTIGSGPLAVYRTAGQSNSDWSSRVVVRVLLLNRERGKHFLIKIEEFITILER